MLGVAARWKGAALLGAFLAFWSGLAWGVAEANERAIGEAVASQRLMAKIREGGCATPRDFGAVGDGVRDDTDAMKRWLDVSAGAPAQKAPCLFLPSGIFRVSDHLIMKMPANSHGPRIWGACGDNSRISFDPGYGFSLVSSVPMFYGDIRCIGITGEIDGPLVTFARSPEDGLNSFNIDSLVVNNLSAGMAAVGIVFNGLYTSRLFVNSNCDGNGHGVGIRFNAAGMNTIKLSAGNCDVGLNLTNHKNSVGGNFFDAIDLEENNTLLLIDGSAVQSNILLGGILSLNKKNSIGIQAISGAANVFKNVSHGGVGKLFGDKKGIIWENPLQDFVNTPPIPDSGISLMNDNAQRVTLNLFGGAVSEVKVNASKICDTTPCMAVLMPGDTIIVRYTEKPNWHWRALQL